MLRAFRLQVRKRLRTLLIVALLLVVGTSVGLYARALHQWRAAQVAVKEGRISEARDHLDLFLRLWPRSIEVHVFAARVERITGNFPAAEDHLNRAIKLGHGATEAVELEFLLMRVQTGEADEVAPLLLNLVEHDHPETPLILETLARAYMYNLHYRSAYGVLNRWIEAEPEAAQPLFLRGWVLERMNNRTGAMEDYKRALELKPDMVPAGLRVAELYLEKSSPLEAQVYLERLHKEFPDRADVKARLGQCRLLQGRTVEARPLLEAAVETMSDDSVLLITLARLELNQRKPAQAETWLRRVLKADPSDSEAQYLLFNSLQLQDRPEEASATLAEHQKNKDLLNETNKLLQDEADHPSVGPAIPSKAGTLLLSLGEERLGMHWLHQALERDPGHRPTHKVLAEYYEKKGDKEKAAAHRRRLGKSEKGSS